MSNVPNDSFVEDSTYRRRTVMGGLAAGASLTALGSEASDRVQAQTDEESDEEVWPPSDATEAHVAVLSGYRAGVETDASGCVHVTPGEEAGTLMVDLVLEDIECVTQAHIHEGGRDDDGPIVAPLLEYTGEVDGTGDGDPLSARPDTPLIEGTMVDDPELVEEILSDPGEYYVNVHTVHHPAGEIRGQIRGFDFGQETDIEPVPAEFTVSNLDPEDVTVVRGDRIDISGRIQNVGDVTDTQTVELRIDDSVLRERELEVTCRSSRTVRFEDIQTGDLDPDEYEHGIFAEDDSETATLTVLRPAEFVVSDLDPDDRTVTRGDLIDVSAIVENVGDVSDTQTVEFRIDDEPVDEEELELEEGESETISFEDIDTADLDPDEYEHGIFTEDDSGTATLTVLSPPAFTVSDLDPEEVTVTQGEPIDVSATVENVGEVTGTQTVELRIDDEVIDERELELDGEESETIDFEGIDTSGLDPDEYEHGIFTDDESETGLLTVEATEENDEDDEDGDGEDENGEDENEDATGDDDDEGGENGEDGSDEEDEGENGTSEDGEEGDNGVQGDPDDGPADDGQGGPNDQNETNEDVE